MKIKVLQIHFIQLTVAQDAFYGKEQLNIHYSAQSGRKLAKSELITPAHVKLLERNQKKLRTCVE